jgi:ribosome-associated protein
MKQNSTGQNSTSQNSSIKEQSLRATTSGSLPLTPTPPAPEPADLDERILLALHAAGEKKAINSIVLDLREITSFTDYFLLMSGNNERQVQAISDGIVETLKKAGSPAARVEGYKTAEWILLDYGDFVVHIFDEKARKFYDLERLWRDSKVVALPAELADAAHSSLRSES